MYPRMSSRTIPSAVVVAVLATAVARPAPGATIDVASGDVAGLVAAIDTANANGEADTIQLAAGTYSLTTGPYAGAGLPALTSEIAIVGAGAATTIIERAMGAPSFRILHTATAAGARLQDVTVHRGTTGVSNSGVLEVEDCVFSANGTALSGGRIEIEGSTITGSTSLDIFHGAVVAGNVTLRGSQIVGNAGAAIRATYGGLIRIVDSTLQGNLYGIIGATGFPSSSLFVEIARSTIDGHASTGVLLSSYYEDPVVRAVVTDSTISNNGGGGIALLDTDDRELVVRRSTLSGNTTTGDGAAILVEGASVAPGGLAAVTIDSSTISGNAADGSGGAIFVANGLRLGRRVQVMRSTITANTADADANGSGDGGGIVAPSKVVDLEDSILAENTDGGGQAPDCQGPIVSKGHNLIGSTAGCAIAVALSDASGPPLLGALAANGGPTETHLPLAGSPALDAADPGRCGAPDQRAFLRPVAGCDVGAVESGAATPVAYPNDHFLCYDTKLRSGTPALPAAPGASLADDIESKSFDVGKTKALCTPADASAAGVLDDETHLHSREIKASAGESRHVPQIGLRFATELGMFAVDTLKAERLLVPTAKGIDAALPPPNPLLHDVDRYKCYKVRKRAGTAALARGVMAPSVLLENQFTAATSFSLTKVARLCTAVDLDAQGRKNPDAHLLCFQARTRMPLLDGAPEPTFTGLFSTSEWGTERLDTKRAYELCLPAAPLS